MSPSRHPNRSGLQGGGPF